MLQYAKIDTSFPVRFSIAAIIFLYILQYPAIQLLFPGIYTNSYQFQSWLIAYAFVLYSTLLFILSLRLGLSGKRILGLSRPISTKFKFQKLPMPLVFIIFVFFAAWSYLMVKLKVGMTIYAEFDPLPFRIAGLLFYGRLFIQPIILLYIAYSYQKSYNKWVILALLFAMGCWTSLASGSRFIAIMFSLPLLLITSSRSRWLFWLSGVFFFIITASFSRHFFLPYYISDEYIQIYANDFDKSNFIEGMWMVPIAYFLGRTMGIDEVILTLNYGSITPTFTDAMLRLMSVFLPFVPAGVGASQKNVYGLDDDAFGGFGLGFFPNYWLMYGGTVLTYSIGLFITGWILGKVYLLCVRIIFKFGLDESFPPFIFVLLFILIFESRSFLFPYILFAIWIFQRPIVISLFGIFLKIISSFFIRQGQRKCNHTIPKES